MDDSQESKCSLSQFDPNDEASSLSQNSSAFFNLNLRLKQEVYEFPLEHEREIQLLERDIRQQKESSANAKTAITFEQLRKIHTISTMLGPHKELFFDRISRAADIQKASLKNRLKSNKEKMETPLFESQSSLFSESQNFIATPTTLQNLFQRKSNHLEMLAPLSSEEDLLKFPTDRQFDLMQLGFSYDEIKQLLELFERFKNDVQEIHRHDSLAQVLNQFCNHISLNAPVHLKVVCSAFNLLELGNSPLEVRRVILKATVQKSDEFDLKRRRADSEDTDSIEAKKPFTASPSPFERSPGEDGTQKV